jgi:hypothetical protein
LFYYVISVAAPRQLGAVVLLHELLEPVWAEQQPLTDIYAPESDAADPRLLAQAFETVYSPAAQVAGETVVYPPTLAEAGNRRTT